MIKLGYAEADITPEKPMELIGFYREDNMSKGIQSALFAQVTVWDNGERCCLITIDSIGFMKELTDVLRIKAGDVLGVSRDKVMVCFSHTHAAPNADSDRQYFEMICDKVLAAVHVAMLDLKTVSVGWENVEVDIGVNRRAGNANVDQRAGILKVYDEERRKNRLIMVRVTAHGNVLKRDNHMLSSDYFGAIREVLQEQYDCPVMVIQGAAGNIAPKYFDSEETPIDARGSEYVRSKDALKNMADEVYRKLSKKIEMISLSVEIPVQMYSKEIILFANVPSLNEAERIASEAQQACGIDGMEWLEEVNRLYKEGIKKQEECVEVQYFFIGDWCLCGVPYEIMVEFALEGVKQTGNEFFYVNGYTNGCLSYFPTEEEFDKGGYEVYWSMLIYYKFFHRVFPFERDSAKKLMAFMVEERQA